MELSAGVVGVGLILVGVALLVVEANVPGWGGPGALGVVATVAGALVLLDDADILDLPRGIVIALLVIAAVFVPVATVLVARARKLPDFVAPSLVGRSGVAVSRLDPVGTVRVSSEEWTAESQDGPIEAGAKVKVVSADGLTLHVHRE